MMKNTKNLLKQLKKKTNFQSTTLGVEEPTIQSDIMNVYKKANKFQNTVHIYMCK